MIDGSNQLYIVFYSDKNYEYQAKGVIESAISNIKGDYKLVYFTIDFDSELDYQNLEKVRIDKKYNLPKFEYYKPTVLRKSIEKFGDQYYLFVDTDILFGKRFDINKFKNQKEFPMLSVGNWDFPYSYKILDNKEIIIDEKKLMSYLGVNERSMNYVYACIISYNTKCLEIIKEWENLCNDNYLLENRESYFPFSDETPLNVILWKRGITENFGRIYLNTLEFEPLKLVEENENLSGDPSNNFGLEGNPLRRCDNSSNIMMYHGMKDEKEIKNTINFFKKNKRIFITFSEGKLYDELTNVLENSIKQFSDYNLKIYKKEDFDIKWEPENWKPGFIYLFKMLSCKKAIEEGYDEIVWIDNDIIVTENIDKIWNYTNLINKNPILPKHRLYNHKLYKSIYGTFKEGGRYLEKTLKKLNVNHKDFEDFYLHACFILFNKETIKTFEEIISLFLSNDYSEELYPNGDESMLNAISFRENSKNLGNIFICTEYFSKEIIEKIISSSKEEYPNIFNKLGPEYELLENNYDNIMFYHGSKDSNLHKEYLNLLIKYKSKMNSEFIRNKYIKSFNDTTISKKIKLESDNLKFTVNFVNNPFFEVKGNSKSDFTVQFFDSKGNLNYKSNLKANMWSKINKQYFEKWTIKVDYDNTFKIFTYDCKDKNVYIAIDSKSLGDNIAWVPYLEEFRKKHDCNLIVSTFWNKLFENKYKQIKFIQPGFPVNDLYAMYKIGWFYNPDMEPELPNTIPLQKAASNILGLEFKEIKPEIDFNPGRRPYNEKYVTIAPHSTAGLKYWNNSTGWQEVVDYLKLNGFKVINISLDKCNINNVEELNDKSIENTMNVIHHSEFFIGLSSGLSWLSWAIGKHVIMISNFTEENHEFTTNCTRVTNKSVCNSCWNNPNFKFDKGDWNWCPVHKGTNRQFECHISITGEKVIEKIDKLLNSN